MVLVDYKAANDAMKPKPPDTYPGRLKSYKYKPHAKNKPESDPMYLLEYVIDGTGDPSLDGTPLFRNYVLSPRAMIYLKKDCITLGADPDVFESDKPFEMDEILDDLIDAECGLVVGVRPDDRGVEQNNLEQVIDKNEIDWTK